MKFTHVLHGFVQCFARPADVLRRLMERGDRFGGWIAVGVSLVLSLLSGLALTRGLVRELLELVIRLTGIRPDGMTTSIQYIAGRAAPAAAGMAVLCCMAALLIPAAVYLLAGCAVCHADVSAELISAHLAVTTAPHIAAQLLCALLSLFSPWAGLAAAVCGMAVSQVLSCHVLDTLTGDPPARMLRIHFLSVALSLAGVLAAFCLILSLLMPAALQSMQALLISAGGMP